MMPFFAKNPSQNHQISKNHVKKRSGTTSIYGGLSKNSLKKPPYKAESVHFLDDFEFLPNRLKPDHLLINWIFYLPAFPLNKAKKTGKTPHIR